MEEMRKKDLEKLRSKTVIGKESSTSDLMKWVEAAKVCILTEGEELFLENFKDFKGTKYKREDLRAFYVAVNHFVEFNVN